MGDAIISFVFFLNPHLRVCSLILERQEGGEREREMNVREKHLSAASPTRPTRGQTHNAGVFPDQGSHPQHFDVWDGVPTN